MSFRTPAQVSSQTKHKNTPLKSQEKQVKYKLSTFLDTKVTIFVVDLLQNIIHRFFSVEESPKQLDLYHPKA